MERTVQMKNGVLAALAVVGSAVSNALGGWDGFLQVLIAMMVCDYITGVLVAAIWKRSGKTKNGALSSSVGFKGIVKKCMILMLVWLAVMMDHAMGTNVARTAVCLFFIGNEGLSLLENIGLMGVPYPAFLKNALEQLKQRGDEGKEEEET